MTDRTEAPPTPGARPMPRLSGVPADVYDDPRRGDSASLYLVRAHLHRCDACRLGILCPTAVTLVRTLESEPGRARGGAQ